MTLRWWCPRHLWLFDTTERGTLLVFCTFCFSVELIFDFVMFFLNTSSYISATIEFQGSLSKVICHCRSRPYGWHVSQRPLSKMHLIDVNVVSNCIVSLSLMAFLLIAWRIYLPLCLLMFYRMNGRQVEIVILKWKMIQSFRRGRIYTLTFGGIRRKS